LGNSFRKLYKLNHKLHAETREERRQILQSRINKIQKERDVYKNDLKILESKRDYDSLSPDGKIRKCILNDGFYVKEATLAVLNSPGVLAGDILQRETTSLGTMGYGHDLSTAHDVPQVAHALGRDGSAAMTATEEADTALSTAPQRDYKGTAFKPLSMQISNSAARITPPAAQPYQLPRSQVGAPAASPAGASQMRPRSMRDPLTPLAEKNRIEGPATKRLQSTRNSRSMNESSTPHSLVPWPEEVSAKSSAAYISRYPLRERFMHNVVKGFGRFAKAVPVFFYQRHQAQTERKKLRRAMADMNQYIQWFAAIKVDNTNKVPAVIADEIKRGHQKIYKALSPRAASNEAPSEPSGRFIANAIPPRTSSRPSLSRGRGGR
jgi:hypothetical protein